MTTLDAKADEAARRVLDLALKLGGREAARGTDGGALLDGDLVGLGGAARVICGADSFGAASPASLDRLREWLAFRDLSSDKLAEPLRSSSVSHSVVTISQDGISVQQISA